MVDLHFRGEGHPWPLSDFYHELLRARRIAEAAAAAALEEEERSYISQGSATKSRSVTVGALTISSDVAVHDDSAYLIAARPSTPPDPLQGTGGGLLRIALPNGNAPLKAFDALLEVSEAGLAPVGVVARAAGKGSCAGCHLRRRRRRCCCSRPLPPRLAGPLLRIRHCC